MFAMWWLVESTNKEGTHDAQLLPFFALTLPKGSPHARLAAQMYRTVLPT